MSHLSILPTLLRDVDLVAEALTDLGQQVHRGGAVEGFAGERVPVLLRLDLVAGPLLGSLGPSPAQTQSQSQSQSKRATRKNAQPLSPSFSLGWARQLDGSLALVGDLGRIAAASPLQELLSQLSRRYALGQALQAAATGGLARADLTIEEPVRPASSQAPDAPIAPHGSDLAQIPTRVPSLARPRPRS
jgi:hypothetical protein